MEQLSPPLSPQTEMRLEAKPGRTMNVALTSPEVTQRNTVSRDNNEVQGMSPSESDSDDENSLSSTHNTTESPPDRPTKPRAARHRLFGRGRRARREDMVTVISDGGRPSSVTQPRRGLFRRRRGRNDRVGEEPRRWRRPAPGVGMSLSDTESRHLRTDVSAGRRVSGTRGSAVDRGAIENGQAIDGSFHGITRGNGTGGGGGSGREAFLYPAPQPLHRHRTSGHTEEEYRLSQDPDFPSPIPFGGEETGAPSSRGQLRYGDYIRLWGYSSYEQKAGYVGYLRRTTRKRNSVGKGELFVLPPVPPSTNLVFHESCFKIVAPRAGKEDGEVVYFGDEISLVDDRGMIWNNKDGRHHGRLGPSLFGNGGHMQLKFLKPVEDTVNDGEQTAVVASPEIQRKRFVGGGKGEVPISYGDTCRIGAKKIRPRRDGVVRAPVTHFRRRRQANLGGYLRSDGKGFPCTFKIHHAPPRISMVTVYSFSAEGAVTDTHTHYKIPWNQELEFELPVEGEWGRGPVNGDEEQESPDDDVSSLPVLRVNLSNGGEMALRARDVKICEDKTIWFDVMGLADPFSILAQSRRQMDAGEGGKGKKFVSIELLTLGGVLVTFSVAKALAARAQRLFFSWEPPIALEVSLDVLISLIMLLVVLRQKGIPAALSNRADRSNSVKYAIKLIKCESGAAQEKSAGEGSGEAENIPPMPDSFLLAECGDHDKAYARWKATVRWRQESGANVALATPHPRFDLIKKQYPTYFHGKDKTGAVIYYEQLGKIDDEELKRVGLDSKQMLWHYMYQMEYLWSVINPVDSDRCTTVLDLKGVSLATAAKAEIMQFIKQAVTMMSTHYPERSTHVILISLPRWFDWIFRFVKPLLSESTKNKISSCTAANVYQTLLSKIDNDQIPREYGGASEHALGEHPYEAGMRENVLRVLAEHKMTLEPLEERGTGMATS